MRKKIFVSHSSKDKVIVGAFVDHILIGGLEFSHSEIVCASSEGMGVESGEEWRKYLKEGLLSVNAIFLIITPNYKSSEICLNEMGAAWTTEAVVLPMIVDPVNYKTVGVLTEVQQIEKLNDIEGLDNIQDKLQKVFSSIKVTSARWTAQKGKFLEAMKLQLNNQPFSEPISEETIKTLKKKVADLTTTNDGMSNKIKTLENYIKELESIKNVEDIKEAKMETGVISAIEEFETSIYEIHEKLKQFDSPIVTLIYNSFTDHRLEIAHSVYRSEIEKAIAMGYINEDFEVLWDDTKEMRELLKSLNNLKEYIEEALDLENFEALEEEYASLDINRLQFWQTVLKIDLHIA